MNVNLVARMLLKNCDGTLFICCFPGPHPQQQATTVDLIWQMIGVLVADPFRQWRANESSGPARQGCRRDNCCKRATRRYDGSSRGDCANVH
jgi:hypothetical protein